MEAPGAPGGYPGYPGAPPMAHGGMPVHGHGGHGGHGSYGMPGAPAPYAQQYGYPPQAAYPQVRHADTRRLTCNAVAHAAMHHVAVR